MKHRKKALKLTTAEIAYRAELPVSTVSKIFTGETKRPAYVTLERICTILAEEEAAFRVRAYYEAYCRHFRMHDPSEAETAAFEKSYRLEHDLTDMPIPYAVPRGTEEEYMDSDVLNNLALAKDRRFDVSDLPKLGLNKWDELIDGRLIVNQAPVRRHQDIVKAISKAIERYIDDNNGACAVYDAGINVEFEDDDYSLFVPDIAVICDKGKLTDMGIKGAPDLVVEVTSPGTINRDYGIKQAKYMLAGVKEYWVVDLSRNKVAVYIEGRPMLTYLYDFDDDIPVHIYNGELTICLAGQKA